MNDGIEKMKNYGTKFIALESYIDKTLIVKKDYKLIANHIANGDICLQNAIKLCQLMERINLENSIFLSPEIGFCCLLLASLCPIFLARKVLKLALHIRIIWQVLKRIFALLLIYLNIITLFKNILVYLHYRKKAFNGEGGFGLSSYNKVIAMMVGELTYEENFVDEGLLRNA